MTPSKIPITVTYRKAGTHPPIFIAGSFSEPAWSPQQMEFTTDEDGEHTFTKSVVAEQGTEIQYKFRVGLGDWWVLNEDLPTVIDAMGNRNNVIEVKRPSSVPKQTEIPKSASKSPIDVLKAEPAGDQSRVSTPDLARTAAEVADSAAMLDQETPEATVPNDEAGNAETARWSDENEDEVGISELSPSSLWHTHNRKGYQAAPPLLAHERFSGARDYGNGTEENGPPLFAHECPEYNAQESDSQRNRRASVHSTSSLDLDAEPYDLADPSLERFPSSRDAIMEQVRRIEEELEEDRASFEGAPLSPVVGPGRRKSADFGGDFLSLSPSTSPVMPRPVKRLDISRGSQGSQTPERTSSAVSLQSIEEEEDVDDVVVLLPSPPRSVLPISKSPLSDEDEGVALKRSGDNSPRSKGTIGPREDILQNDLCSTHDGQSESPKIIVHSVDLARSVPEDMATPRSDQESTTTDTTTGSTGSASTGQDHLAEDDTLNSEVPGEDGASSQLRKRTRGERPGTPTSVHSTSIDAAKNKGWVRAFFRLVFVDWIGGFFWRLWGSNRNAMMTAGTAAVVMGIAWWKTATRDTRDG